MIDRALKEAGGHVTIAASNQSRNDITALPGGPISNRLDSGSG